MQVIPVFMFTGQGRLRQGDMPVRLAGGFGVSFPAETVLTALL